MLSFVNDYSEGAHPAILRRLSETNMEQLPGYGSDHYCASAKDRIRKACGAPDADVWFLVGGTQTNQNILDAVAPPYAGILCADNGHINVHEAGAIESTGRKVLAIPGHDGKLSAADVSRWCEGFFADANQEHMVCPGAVYISHPTEYGTLYSAAELEGLSKVCREYHLPLVLDGARLGYGLTAPDADPDLADIARLTDVFTIGGTKVGALFGEAVVFTHTPAPKHFLTMIKRRGALLAKGWLLGLQFDTLFTDDLYLSISRHANEEAGKIRAALKAKGYRLANEASTNQILVTMDHATIDRLSHQVGMGFMLRVDDDHDVMRICTSWATTDEHTDQLIALL